MASLILSVGLKKNPIPNPRPLRGDHWFIHEFSGCMKTLFFLRKIRLHNQNLNWNFLSQNSNFSIIRSFTVIVKKSGLFTHGQLADGKFAHGLKV